MKTKTDTKQLVLMGLLTAVLILMAFTPLGYLNIGPLAITFNVIPVAVAAITLGPMGGAFAGAVFGITSILQCIGIGGTSIIGTALFQINPILEIIHRLIPRVLDGLLIGFIFNGIKKWIGSYKSCFIAGFFSAFLNTLLFMAALILLFGNTDYVRELIGGRNILIFICSYVGVNAVFEMIASTIITGLIGSALIKARLIKTPVK